MEAFVPVDGVLMGFYGFNYQLDRDLRGFDGV